MADMSHLSVDERKKAKQKKIVVVALILAFVTAIEFVFAFTMGAGTLRTTLFILLTIVKAYYIMYEFMHLGHESSPLKMAVLFPLAFVAWFLVAMMWESSSLWEMIPGRYFGE